MDEWTKRRTCSVCGEAYTLHDHDADVAAPAATALAHNPSDLSFLPAAAVRCGECLVADLVDEQTAVAVAMRIGEEYQDESRAMVHWYAFRVGTFTGVLGAIGLLMLLGYTQLRRGAFDPTFLAFVLLCATGIGVATASWAFVQGRAVGRH